MRNFRPMKSVLNVLSYVFSFLKQDGLSCAYLKDRKEGRGRQILLHWEIATLLMAGDICVFRRIEEHMQEKACQESFNILFQRTNYKGICDLSENLRKEENGTKEEAMD